jgi:hypothetical protein
MEAAMRLPRFTISSLMTLVLLVALNLGGYKALRMEDSPAELSDLLVFGALPMANVLAIGLYRLTVARTRNEKDRRGLLGFELGGLVALVIFLACSLTITHSLHEGVGHLVESIGLKPGLLFVACAASLLLLSQVAPGFLVSRLARTYKLRVGILVERRTLPGLESGPTPERLSAKAL